MSFVRSVVLTPSGESVIVCKFVWMANWTPQSIAASVTDLFLINTKTVCNICRAFELYARPVVTCKNLAYSEYVLLPIHILFQVQHPKPRRATQYGQ